MAYDELTASLVRDVNKLRVEVMRADEQVQELRQRIAAIEQVTPACLPDGTGVLSPERWIEWAKAQLGYASTPPSIEPHNEGGA